MRWHASGFDAVDRRFRNRVGVVAYVVFVVIAVFADVIGDDSPAILKMDSVGAGNNSEGEADTDCKEGGDTGPHSGAF